MRFDDMIANRKTPEEKIRLVTATFHDYERRRQRTAFIVIVPIIAIFALILWQVVTAPTNIGAPTTESESIVRTNERLLEMVKWTITTLLIGGGALVGLNWYMGEARYNLERSLAEQERLDYQVELESTMSIAIGLVEDEMEEVRERLLELEHPGEELPTYEYDYETGEYTLLDLKEDLDNDDGDYRDENSVTSRPTVSPSSEE